MGEIIYGVQVIRMYGWEKAFSKLIAWCRKIELKFVQKSLYVLYDYLHFG